MREPAKLIALNAKPTKGNGEKTCPVSTNLSVNTAKSDVCESMVLDEIEDVDVVAKNDHLPKILPE